MIGQFCAFDHWRQRIVLVDNVVVPPGSGGVPDPVQVSEAYEGACARLRQLAADCARSQPGEMVGAPPAGLEKAAAAADDDIR